MSEVVTIPKATVARLPVYFRALMELSHLEIPMISSEELAARAGVNSSQLRKDLSYFGEFGIRGAGYDVGFLLKKVREILGITRGWRLVIVGAGKLGTALTRYGGFTQHGLEVSAIFDSDLSKVGKKIGRLTVQPMNELSATVKNSGIEIGVITVPVQGAQDAANHLIEAGIAGIWNFAPVRLEVPEHIYVQYEDLVVNLLTLSHHLSRNKG